MPVFKCNTGNPPEWSEVNLIRIVELEKGGNYMIRKHFPKEKFFIGEGRILLMSGKETFNLKNGDVLELNNNGSPLTVIDAEEDSIVIRVGGNWNEDCGSCGIFKLDKSDNPANEGDPVDYERNTYFDNHFHDCDEFWIIFDGKGEIVTEGNRYEINKGDCVATRAGDHHDFPVVNETIRGVYFETSLRGKKRIGHLWNHKLNEE